MMKSQYMIQDRPGLVKYFTSRNPGQLLLFILPLLLGSLALSTKARSPVLLASSVLAGMVYWTFLEYIIHRFIYHTQFKHQCLHYFVGSFHLYHHKDMSDRRVLNAGFLMIYGLTPIIVSPALIFTRNPALIGALALGIVLAYSFYECVHFLLHYKHYESGYLGYIQRYHFFHHDHAPLRNFGNTSHFWDRVFGTYDERYKTYQISEKTRATLVTAAATGTEASHA